MDKQKWKSQQQNFLNYFLDEFILFRRDFSFVTHLSPDKVVKAFQKFPRKPSEWWLSGGIIRTKVCNESNPISFEVAYERPVKTGYSMNAKAVGTIYAKNGMTIIEGSAVLHISHLVWISLIVFSLIMFMYMSIDIAIAQFVLFNIVLIPLWLQMYFDRNYLLKIIENAVLPEKAKSKA